MIAIGFVLVFKAQLSGAKFLRGVERSNRESRHQAGNSSFKDGVHVKPGPDGGRPKARWVACGNYESKKEDENNYSSGADATAFRVLVWKSAKEQWVGVVIDVKTAFFNAAMDQKGDEGILLIKPPTILVEKQFMTKEALFLPLRAVYGFRRSPRLWGDHRDSVMKTIKIQFVSSGQSVELVLEPLESEPNLWKVVKAEGEKQRELEEEFQLYGMVMTYVDDIFISGCQPVVEALLKEFQSIWVTSKPEWVSSSPVRFLGMEVTKEMDPETQREVWLITQESYIKDLVRCQEEEKEEEEVKEKKIPISRDQAAMEVDEEPPNIEKVRKCQKAVGEVLWLVTRTRPDIMFSVARMGANVTRATKKVMEAASQLWGFLKKTSAEGLRYAEETEEELVIQVYTDASFAPEGEQELNTPGSALWTEDDPPEPALDFDVYYTQYGAVYHPDRACGHLKGPKVGQVFQGRWCRTCQKKAGRQNKAPLPGKKNCLESPSEFSTQIFSALKEEKMRELQCVKAAE